MNRFLPYITYLLAFICATWGPVSLSDDLSTNTKIPDAVYTKQTAQIDLSYFEGNYQEKRSQRLEYSQLKDHILEHPDLANSQQAVALALAFFVKNKDRIRCQGPRTAQKITNREWMVVNDYTKPHDEKRQFLINIKTGEVVSTYTAHGYGSNQPSGKCPEIYRITCVNRYGHQRIKCKIPLSFANTSDVGTTLRGFFTTANQYRSTVVGFRVGDPPYQPGANNGVRLVGLQNGINETALGDGKVWHRAAYADKTGGKNSCSSSAGCPAVPPEVFEKFKDAIDGGALMYNHTILDQEKRMPEC